MSEDITIREHTTTLREAGNESPSLESLEEGSTIELTTVHKDNKPFETKNVTLTERIKEGGYGKVFRAEKENGMVSVLKIIPSGGDKAVDEARTMGRLEHPKIVPVKSVHTFEDPRGNQHIAIEMAEIQGHDLSSYIGGKLSTEQVASYTQDIAEALDFAHKNGITHADVKPGNILIHDSGHAYLTDFGTSIASKDPELAETPQGTSMFMAPEVKKYGIGSAKPKSDIFSLGATVFTMIEGQSPWDKDVGDEQEFVYPKIGEVARKRLENQGINVDNLDSVLEKSMKAKNPDERYDSASDFAAALKEALTPQSTS